MYCTKEWKGKKVWVAGLGRSGVAAAKVLSKLGAVVYVSEGQSSNKFSFNLINELQSAGVRLLFEDDFTIAPVDIEVAVISPGISINLPAFQKLKQNRIEVMSEIELAYRLAPQVPLVAITGTNGKTTTTTLVGEICKQEGMETIIAGNIGIPLVQEALAATPEQIIVAEISSFQLEAINKFHPKIAVILNITPDHLDRHGTMENYANTKARIFVNQTPNDFTVLNADDPLVYSMAAKTSGKVVLFSRKRELDEGIFVRNGIIIQKFYGKENEILPVEELGIKGAHNLENAMAAIGAAYGCGITLSNLRKTLREFAGVEHRLELVRELDGVKYINDSKGTNPDAAIKAIEAYPNPLILIAGGKDKGTSFNEFAQKIKERVRELILIGQAAEKIEAAVKALGFCSVHHARSLEEAVQLGRSLARPGEIVLLSPACASFDMFKNFEERGEVFKKAVCSLK